MGKIKRDLTVEFRKRCRLHVDIERPVLARSHLRRGTARSVHHGQDRVTDPLPRRHARHARGSQSPSAMVAPSIGCDIDTSNTRLSALVTPSVSEEPVSERVTRSIPVTCGWTVSTAASPETREPEPTTLPARSVNCAPAAIASVRTPSPAVVTVTSKLVANPSASVSNRCHAVKCPAELLGHEALQVKVIEPLTVLASTARITRP